MRIKNAFLLTLGLLLLGMFSFSTIASATTGAGGQVSVKGQITFYEGSTEPSTSDSTTPSSSSEVPKDSTSTSASSTGVSTGSSSTTKPQGSFPSTGETIRNYSFMGVGVILLLVLILWSRRKKKEEQA